MRSAIARLLWPAPEGTRASLIEEGARQDVEAGSGGADGATAGGRESSQSWMDWVSAGFTSAAGSVTRVPPMDGNYAAVQGDDGAAPVPQTDIGHVGRYGASTA